MNAFFESRIFITKLHACWVVHCYLLHWLYCQCYQSCYFLCNFGFYKVHQYIFMELYRKLVSDRVPSCTHCIPIQRWVEQWAFGPQSSFGIRFVSLHFRVPNNISAIPACMALCACKGKMLGLLPFRSFPIPLFTSVPVWPCFSPPGYSISHCSVALFDKAVRWRVLTLLGAFCKAIVGPSRLFVLRSPCSSFHGGPDLIISVKCS